MRRIARIISGCNRTWLTTNARVMKPRWCRRGESHFYTYISHRFAHPRWQSCGVRFNCRSDSRARETFTGASKTGSVQVPIVPL